MGLDLQPQEDAARSRRRRQVERRQATRRRRPSRLAPVAVAAATASLAPAEVTPARPPGATWSWARSRDVVLTLLGVAGLLYVAGGALHSLIGVFAAIVVAALLAFLMRPLVAFLEQYTSLRRTPAATVVFAGVIVLVVGGGAWVVSQLTTQATAAVAGLPATLQALRLRLPEVEASAARVGLSLNVQDLQERLLANLEAAGLASEGLSRGAAWVTALGEGLLNVVLVLFLSFYFILDGDRLVNTLLALAPARTKPYVLFAQKTLAQVVGGYVRGQLTVAAIVGGTVFLICLVLGVRYSLVLGVLAFFFEWVPYVGPTMAGVAMTAVALTDSFWRAGLVLGFYVVLQTLESHVLAPRITGRAVGLHPAVALLGFVVGAKLFGLWGLFFAVPLLGFVYLVLVAVYQQFWGPPATPASRAR